VLQILVSNNIRIRGASVPLREEITAALTLDNPVYIERKSKKRPTWGIDKKLTLYTYDRGDLIVPRGFYVSLVDILLKHGINPHEVVTKRLTEGWKVDFGEWNAKYIPKEDQRPAIKAVLLKNGVLVAPAGSGKTLMGMWYIWEKGRPALWLTHTKDLMYQSAKNAERYLLGVGRVGILGDGKQEWGDGKLIVATVQTLQAHPHLVETLKPIIGTLVIDEAHHFPAPAFLEVAGQFPAANVLGLTATPERKDKLECYLYAGVGPIVYEIKRDGLYESGRLIKPEIRFVYTEFDYEQASDRNEIDSVDAGGEDLNYNALMEALINDEKRAQLVAENIVKHAPGNYSIVLTERVEYGYLLQSMIQNVSKGKLRVSVVHGKLPKKERKEILDAAYRKEVDVLIATQLAREGLDMPHLTIGHMVTPKRGDASGSRNGAAVEQEIGRIMRPDPANPDKKAIWFDYVDYNVGVFRSQYSSRRSVYKRLGLKVPKKPRTERDEIADFLSGIRW